MITPERIIAMSKLLADNKPLFDMALESEVNKVAFREAFLREEFNHKSSDILAPCYISVSDSFSDSEPLTQEVIGFGFDPFEIELEDIVGYLPLVDTLNGAFSDVILNSKAISQIEDMDVSHILDLSFMFRNTWFVDSFLNLNSINTESAITMRYMFSGIDTTYTNIVDWLPSINTSNVMDLQGFLIGCDFNNGTVISFGEQNWVNVTDCSHLFSQATLTDCKIDMSKIKFGDNPKKMSDMFSSYGYKARGLEIDLSCISKDIKFERWQTRHMFKGVSGSCKLICENEYILEEFNNRKK